MTRKSTHYRCLKIVATLTAAILISSLLTNHAYAQPGGGGPPGGGGGFTNFDLEFNPSTYVLTVSFDGTGSNPSPAPWCQIRQDSGIDIITSYTDMNGTPISVASGAHEYEFLLPNATGSFQILILKGWIVPGMVDDEDPNFFGRTFSIDEEGNVTIDSTPLDVIGYTGIFAVQTSRPCDQGSDPSCARFPGACPVQQCDMQQHQDLLRVLSTSSLQGIYGLTVAGGASCSSCGTSGAEVGTAYVGFSNAGASCSGGRVPPGAPTKNCEPSIQGGMVDVGLVLREDFGAFNGSFGLGGFMGAYDGQIQRFDLPNGVTKLRYFDPAYGQVYTMDYDDEEDEFYDPQNRIRKVIHVDGDPRVIYHDGAWIQFSYFELYDEDDDLDRNGFVTLVGDALGRVVEIDRDTDGTILTISDSYDNLATITYASTLYAGRPAIESIEFTSDGTAPRELTFDYEGNHLSEIKLSGNLLWAAELTVNGTTQTAQLEVYNAFSGTRYYHYTQDYVLLYGMLHAQPSNLLRGIENSNNEILAALFVNPSDSHDRYEMIGDTILKHYEVEIGPSLGTTTVRYATDWSLGDIEDGWDAIEVTSEEGSGATIKCSYPSFVEAEIEAGIRAGTASEIQDQHGTVVEVEYDDDGFVTKRTYGTSDYEEFTLNVNKKITSHRRRDGVTVTYAYLDDVLVESVTQGGATREFEYYGGTDARKYLLKESRDPLYDSGSPTMHCTTFDYDTDTGLLLEVLGPAATSMATRPITEYTYNARRQRTTTTVGRAVGNDVVEEYNYDDIGRVIQIDFLSDGTNRQFSYIDSENNPFTANGSYGLDHCTKNTPVLIKDRTDRVQCRLQNHFKNTYSQANYGTSDDIFEASNITVNTNVNQDTITGRTYYTGTELPLAILTNGDKQSFEYDYRGRRTEVTQHTADGETLVSVTTYGSNNRLLSTTDPYGRKTWYGRSVSSGQLLRTIQEFVPSGISLSDNASVLSATRTTSNNAKFAISDSNYDGVGRLVETIDPLGMVTKLEYNNRDQRTKQTVAYGTGFASVTESDFDDAGNVTEVRHPRYFDSGDTDGYQEDKTTYVYDGANRNISVTRAPGHALEATSETVYYWDGRVHKTIDPLNNETERLYVGCCDRTQVSENALGHGSISNADPEGRSYHSAFVADVAGHSNYYDPDNADTFQESTTGYDSLGRAFRNTRWNVPLGQVDWDDVPAAGFNSVSGTDGVTSQTFFDVNLTDDTGLDNSTGITVTIPLTGSTFNVSLDTALAKLAQSTANGGANTSFATNSTGSATVSVNHDASNVTIQISDGAGRTVMSGQLKGPADANPSHLLDWRCISYDNVVTISGYGDVQEIQSIDQAGLISKTRTDAGGRTMESYDTLNKKSWAEYDPAGNVKKSRDPNGVGFDAVYDILSRMTSQEDTFADETSTEYDKAGNVVAQTDAKSNTTTTVYDVLGRTKGVTDRLTNETAYTYDLAGRMTSIIDAQSKTTSYTYNALGAKTEETYPDHTGGSSGDATYGKVKFTYDPAGRMIRREDQKGDTVTFNHTMAGTITSRNYRTKANSPSGTITDTDTFTFDAMGRMLTAVSGRYTNTVTMTYDNYGRLDDESLTIASQTYTVTRGYDSRGRLDELTYPNGSVVERTYTDRSQLHTVDYLGSTVDTRTYDDGGRLGTSTYANGAVITFSYRNDNLPSSIATSHAGSPNIGTYSYSWDENKNKTGETISGTMSGFGFSTGSTGYDDEDRLTAWERIDTNLDQAWTLSAVGNWSSFSSDSSTWSRTHSDAHEFTGFTGTSSGSLTYDVKGNQTSRPSTLSAPALNFEWNFDNQLIGADINGSSGSLEVNFEYDALGRRVARSRDKGAEVVYVHAGQQVIADYDRGTAASTPTYRYVYADYMDEPILRHSGTGTTLPGSGDDALFYHRNQQYSIIGLTNAAGTLVERYSYTAYGTLGIYDPSGTVRTTSSYANRYTYTGREYDPDLNLYHFRARWYDPATGGFISRDPLEMVDGPSTYRGYFAVNGLDPYGLVWIRCRCFVRPDDAVFGGWIQSIEVDCPCGGATCCKEACQGIHGGSFEPGWYSDGWDVTGGCTGGDCRFFVRFDTTGNQIGDACKCQHADLYSTCKGEIRTGFGGSVDPKYAPGNPTSIREDDTPLYVIGDGTLKFGTGKDKSCRTATWQDIDSCIRAYPKPKDYDMTGFVGENCRTDVSEAARACCLVGF